MSFRRMAPFLLLNILVSAAVVLAILYWWDGRNSGDEVLAVATATAVIPTPTSMPCRREMPRLWRKKQRWAMGKRP